MTRLHLIRHGETELGREGRAQGHSEVGLNDNGRRQALQLAEALAGGGQKFSGLYSSDLPRARETAEVVAAAFPGLAVSDDARLREKDPGRLAGLNRFEMQRRWPEWWLANQLAPGSTRAPGGESFEDLQARLLPAIEEMADAHPEGDIAVVTHGGPIKVLVCHTLGLSLDGVDLLALDHCRVTVIEWGPSPRLISFNCPQTLTQASSAASAAKP